MAMRRRHVPLELALVILLGAAPGFAQSVDEGLRKDIEALKQGQAEIRKELQELKDLLRARLTPRPASAVPENLVLTVAGAPLMGDRNAKVTLFDFSDYQCPFCRRHVQQTLPEIVKDYVRTGKVRYVFRDFPIASLHPKAHKLHEAAYCAGEQDKYWEMHARLFENPQGAELKDLVGHAQALALDVPRFEGCVASEKYVSKVRQGVTDGQSAGVNGTPTFFVGLTDVNDARVKPSQVIRGAQAYPVFKQILETLLSVPK
jgi:protein-disulfide isomerase